MIPAGATEVHSFPQEFRYRRGCSGPIPGAGLSDEVSSSQRPHCDCSDLLTSFPLFIHPDSCPLLCCQSAALTPATAFSSLADVHPPGSVFCRDLSCLDLSCLAFSSWKHTLEQATTSPSSFPHSSPEEAPPALPGS